MKKLISLMLLFSSLAIFQTRAQDAISPQILVGWFFNMYYLHDENGKCNVGEEVKDADIFLKFDADTNRLLVELKVNSKTSVFPVVKIVDYNVREDEEALALDIIEDTCVSFIIDKEKHQAIIFFDDVRMITGCYIFDLDKTLRSFLPLIQQVTPVAKGSIW